MSQPASPLGSISARQVVALLFGATLLAYLPALGAGFIWDDDEYLARNPLVTGPEGFARIWFELGATPQYYPLVFSSFRLEHGLWGLRPLGYHLVNVLLHASSAVVLWRILSRLQVAAAPLAAALFALHPVHVESVAWVFERKNVLSGLCYLGAAWAFLQAHLDRVELGAQRKRLLSLAVVLFGAALLSKTVTASLPAALVLVLWWRASRPSRPEVAALVAMGGVGVGFGFLTVWMERTQVGAQGSEWNLTVLERVLVAGRALWFYLWKLLFPMELSFVYPRWTIDGSALWQRIFPVAAVGLIVGLWAVRRRLGRGPLAAALFFGGTLTPALGFLNVFPHRYSWVADHFQYLASLAPLVLLAVLIHRASERLRPRHRLLGLAVLLVPLAVLGAKTSVQTLRYKDSRTLWAKTVEENPQAAIALVNLGRQLEQAGEAEAGLNAYAQAVKVNPEYWESHNNYAAALAERGRFDEALVHFQEAVRLNPMEPQVNLNLARLLDFKKRPAEAVGPYRIALYANPADTEVRLALALVLENSARRGEAIAELERILAVNPNHRRARFQLERLRRAEAPAAR